MVWHTPTQNIFAAVDPDLWSPTATHCGCFRRSPRRIAELSTDTDFIGRLREAAADLESYLADSAWFGDYAATLDGDPTHAAPSGIAYFSMEFGISGTAHLFRRPRHPRRRSSQSGIGPQAAADRGRAVHRSGCFRQSLSHDGWQVERYPVNDPTALPLTLLTGTDGARCSSPSRCRAAAC